MKKLLLHSISNIALFMAVTSIAQCSAYKMYQPDVNTKLKDKTLALAQEKWHNRGHGSDKVL